MIVILSVTCIVPKYHCLLHDCDTTYSETLYLVTTWTLEVPLHLCFASLMGASEISLCHIFIIFITSMPSVQISYYSLFSCLWLFHELTLLLNDINFIAPAMCLFSLIIAWTYEHLMKAVVFVKVFFLAFNLSTELLEDKQYAKLEGVDMFQTYLIFQTLLLLFCL